MNLEAVCVAYARLNIGWFNSQFPKNYAVLLNMFGTYVFEVVCAVIFTFRKSNLIYLFSLRFFFNYL